jgi:hypothetical protein
MWMSCSALSCGVIITSTYQHSCYNGGLSHGGVVDAPALSRVGRESKGCGIFDTCAIFYDSLPGFVGGILADPRETHCMEAINPQSG